MFINKKKIIIVTSFFTLALLIYGSSLFNEFIWFDDNTLIFENPAVKTLKWSSIVWAFTHFDPELYIPLTLLSYQIEHAIAGLNPFVFHLTNLVLHTFNALLVVTLTKLLTGKKWIAIVTGLLFLTHPLNTEAVAWASARKDVLSTFFFLISFVSFLHFKEATRYPLPATRCKCAYIFSLTAFALGLLSKVSILTLPLLLLLTTLWMEGKLTKKNMLPIVPFFALSTVFGIIAILGKQAVLAASPLTTTFLMACKSTSFYLQQFILPTKLSVIYPYNESISLTSPDFLVALLVLTILAILILRSLRKTTTIFFLSLAFLITLAPSFTNYAKGEEFYFASDRYVYIPYIALFILVGGALWKLRKHRTLMFNSLVAIAIAASAFLSFNQSKVWQSTETLFGNVLKHFDYSHIAHNKVGAALIDQGKLDEAEERLLSSVEIKPTARAFYNLGIIYLSQDDLKKSFAATLNAATLSPDHIGARTNLGYLYSQAGMWGNAAEELEAAAGLAPGDIDVLVNLAGVYIALERGDEARELLDKALRIEPENPFALELLERL